MDNRPGEHIFGLEVEFAYAARGPDGQQLPTGAALDAFFALCADRCRFLRGRDGVRLFLENGSLLYPDVGHPELATAECSSPQALLLALRAGEKLVTGIAEELHARAEFSDLNLYRSNVDYAAGTTWGCHESYLSRRSPKDYAPAVVPHLVSRMVYSGAGGFDNRNRTAAFAVSPRAFHLSRVIGGDSGGLRAIFSLRDESLSKTGQYRVHLICGEPNCAELSTYLKVGTTALVLAMADAGVDFGELGGILRSPLAALKSFAADQSCRVRVQVGASSWWHAIDIQRCYLELAETHQEQSFMPEWAPEVCRIWRHVLDDLDADPERLVGRLDWTTKLALFKRYVAAHSHLPWQALPAFGTVVAAAERVCNPGKGSVRPVRSRHLERTLKSPSRAGRSLRALEQTLRAHDCSWDDYEAFLTLRSELCELDMRYGQLCPAGIHQQLLEAGEIREELIDQAAVERAVHIAPSMGRARVRGDWIRQLSDRNKEYWCDWGWIASETRILDLGDPFVRQATWTAHSRGRRRGERLDDLLL